MLPLAPRSSFLTYILRSVTHLLSATMATSWENARRHARALEQALETKLSSYSKIAAGISRGGASGAAAGSSRGEINVEEEGEEGYRLVEEEVEELVGKVSYLKAEN